MNLIRPQLVRNAEAETPEGVFAEKYDWLLRWAMHFTQCNRTAAEDLVQDSFVRLIVSWPKIKDDISQVEPFLYSTLKYAYLMEQRRARRVNFQDLALIEFDDLRLILKEENISDPIEVQDDLRRVVAYLCWRKHSAKSASVLLLRFFHGYYPEEIGRITLMKRGVVDKLLSTSREEVKAYLANPSCVEIMHYGKPPELMPRQVALSPERFAYELQSAIFEARKTPCLNREELLKHYEVVGPKPISCELLAHIVSCERCLNMVNSIFDFPSASQRRSDAIAHAPRRSKRGSSTEGKASSEEIQRSIAGGRDRYRKLYEHRPRGLMIAVNGDILAMRDVNSANSELKVQLVPERSLGMIDVLSEQGVSLLCLFVPTMPPEAPPEICHEIALSDHRKLELLLRFTSEGAVIVLRYHDPSLMSAAEPSIAEMEEALEEDSIGLANVLNAQTAGVVADRRSRWRKLLDKISLFPWPEFNPMFATAMACALAAVVFLVLSYRMASVMNPQELLRRASSAEVSTGQQGSGIIVQKVRIHTPHRTLERTLYRDVEQKRRLKAQPESRDDMALESQLAAVGILWDDPLSVASFRHWHDRPGVSRDVVKRGESGLLTLTSTLSDGAIASESLTVRESDFHPVERKIELRNAGTIEIAELNYSVLPWSSVNPNLFESVPMGFGGDPAFVPSLRLPALPTVDQLDEAELEVRLVLSRLRMDASERIEIDRGSDGIHVQGIVDTYEAKRQLQTQLQLLPHVIPAIFTVQEMESRQSTRQEITHIRETSVETGQSSALDRYALERGIDKTVVMSSAQEFMDSSFAVKHESQEIADLLERFSTKEALSEQARVALSELLVQHKAALLNALGKEEKRLFDLQLALHPDPVSTESGANGDLLKSSAERNFSLCVNLTSGSDSSAHSARSIAPQLATSIAQLRAVVLHISAASQLGQSSANASAANPKR